MIVIDTHVLSELMRPEPAPAVIHWVAGKMGTELFTTTITMAEIGYGLALLADGKRKTRLSQIAEAIFSEDFAGRVLPFDSAAASVYGHLCADRREAGQPIATLDAQIAAIAKSRGAKLATRNTRDFRDCGLEVVCPW